MRIAATTHAPTTSIVTTIRRLPDEFSGAGRLGEVIGFGYQARGQVALSINQARVHQRTVTDP
uniref:Uncharacterized protein n=1 Tax=uncultured myxobacterium HF0200_08J13 TaxID=723558 RepID=E7C3Q0_9BACT|nr:hypothetical protein [uncultured myxobacterium HF0200_08J13]